MCAHQPGSEPIDIPETIPNPVIVPKQTPTPKQPVPKEPVQIPEKVPGTARIACEADGAGDPIEMVGAQSYVTIFKERRSETPA